ncbi:hypothetical protein UFOVP997_43 [uncultured Caudovirales phage]|uniref:Uncharacterized protein n=1 Tax=uncultured Caudovirales phage TaxID=2100421 RepID=A0A6J5SE82_9CAUD|nr:hypothetical protein UFOVP486_28 [uncultured Caudovirales phage]CAB4170243.1 hypothetical protein UFOVP911_9 [uncultured Caudovirales phage]CAB4177392.1 hypothetical protein UFOVP997_43 [uncultured Caudovirales phage]CAB4182817.1 hypothetical protein UFOVP1088_23 [uncultured Caudovirales phage]CAB4186441.1 hypothetical protein UFOVP1149_40 [uncultured Caudovirales phage]
MKEPISEWNMYDKVKIFEAARQAVSEARKSCDDVLVLQESRYKLIAERAAFIEITNQRIAFAAMDDQLITEYERQKKLLEAEENEDKS